MAYPENSIKKLNKQNNCAQCYYCGQDNNLKYVCFNPERKSEKPIFIEDHLYCVCDEFRWKQKDVFYKDVLIGYAINNNPNLKNSKIFFRPIKTKIKQEELEYIFNMIKELNED